MFVLCDPRDIGVSERVRDPHFSIPAIYLYDRYPGGTGLAEALSLMLLPLVRASLERLDGCACVSGCPSCIGVDLGGDLSFGRQAASVKSRIAEFLRTTDFSGAAASHGPAGL